MKQLFLGLNVIGELLQQIHTITGNQTTVLLDSEEESSLDLLEQMFEYKSTLMSELEQAEQVFQGHYQKMRAELEGKSELITLQKEVGNVLKIKEEIVVMEQKNLLIMQEKTKRHRMRIEVTPNAKQVTNAYKQYERPREK